MSPKEFINRAADACLQEQLATVTQENLREHWGRIIRKYMWAQEDQWTNQMDKVRKLVLDIEMHCPCGARPESPATFPHMFGCPVAEILWLLNKETNAKKGPLPDPTLVETPIK